MPCYLRQSEHYASWLPGRVALSSRLPSTCIMMRNASSVVCGYGAPCQPHAESGSDQAMRSHWPWAGRVGNTRVPMTEECLEALFICVANNRGITSIAIKRKLRSAGGIFRHRWRYRYYANWRNGWGYKASARRLTIGRSVTTRRRTLSAPMILGRSLPEQRHQTIPAMSHSLSPSTMLVTSDALDSAHQTREQNAIDTS